MLAISAKYPSVCFSRSCMMTLILTIYVPMDIDQVRPVGPGPKNANILCCVSTHSCVQQLRYCLQHSSVYWATYQGNVCG